MLKNTNKKAFYRYKWAEFFLFLRVLFDLLITGISLNPEQWNQLKEQISEIDDAVKTI